MPFEWAKTEKTSAELEGVECGDFISYGAKGDAWKGALLDAERHYRTMIDFGCTPQEARNVLPLSTKTELIMTGTHSQWTDMLKLRLDRAAHPQMRYLMELLVRNELFPKSKIETPEVDNEQN